MLALRAATRKAVQVASARPSAALLSTGRLATAQADSLLTIGTRDIFDSDHDMFRESARKFFEEEVVPFHPQWEKDGEASAWVCAPGEP